MKGCKGGDQSNSLWKDEGMQGRRPKQLPVVEIHESQQFRSCDCQKYGLTVPTVAERAELVVKPGRIVYAEPHHNANDFNVK